MDSPCYDRKNKIDCPKRESGCSANCKEWKEYETARNLSYLEKLRIALAANAVYETMHGKFRRRKKK